MSMLYSLCQYVNIDNTANYKNHTKYKCCDTINLVHFQQIEIGDVKTNGNKFHGIMFARVKTDNNNSYCRLTMNFVTIGVHRHTNIGVAHFKF